jgi:hypothetical protein
MADNPEEHFSEVDWDNIAESEKSKIIDQQSQYAMASVKLVYSVALHGSDMKNLLSSLILSLILALFSINPKNIVISLLVMQTFFVFISRVGSIYNARLLNTLKDAYIDLLKKNKKP